MPDLVLADTSIWVSHLRKGEDHFIQRFDEGGLDE